MIFRCQFEALTVYISIIVVFLAGWNHTISVQLKIFVALIDFRQFYISIQFPGRHLTKTMSTIHQI